MTIGTYADEVLTTNEVAAMLKVKPGYVYQLKAQHKIPFHKMGKSVRFLRSEILNWIKSDAESV